MKKLFLLFLIILLHTLSFAQTIKISNDVELIKINESAYVHVSYSQILNYGRVASNGFIFINESKAFLFDTPTNDSLTKILTSFINDSLKVKIIGFIPNHWHSDCMGGLKYLQSIGIESYANQKTIDIAKTKGLPIPTHGFKDSLSLNLGDKVIKCYYFGAGHSLDNIVVWIPSEKILFAGCMVKEVNAKGLGNITDADTTEWKKTIQKLFDRFKMAKMVIPGHGKSGRIELIQHTKELLNQ